MFRHLLPAATILMAALSSSAVLASDEVDPLGRPGVADLLRAAAAQIEAGDLAAADATLTQALGDWNTSAAESEAAAADPERMVALYKEGDVALTNGDVDTARAKWGEALSWTDDERAVAFIGSMLATLDVVGQPAGEPTVTKTIQGKVPDLSKGTTLIFFFEPWCPHCQKELPTLQARLPQLEARGIEVLGLTRLTRDTTDKDVKQLIKQGGLAYPIAVESGETSDRFGVDGVPAAAVVKDGVIVWRGHPMQLGDGALDRFAAK